MEIKNQYQANLSIAIRITRHRFQHRIRSFNNSLRLKGNQQSYMYIVMLTFLNCREYVNSKELFRPISFKKMELPTSIQLAHSLFPAISSVSFKIHDIFNN